MQMSRSQRSDYTQLQDEPDELSPVSPLSPDHQHVHRYLHTKMKYFGRLQKSYTDVHGPSSMNLTPPAHVYSSHLPSYGA